MQPWKHALRSLARRPYFSIAVCGLLMLGIGVNTALFSVVDTVLWKPLPYPAADRLAALMEASPAKSQKISLVAPGRIEDWNRLSRTFSAIAGSYTESVTDTSGAEPQRLSGRRVSPRYFDVFGSAPIVGRTFTPDEDRFGGPHAAVISYELWSRRYGQDPRITARRLVISGEGYSIVGVMPPNFTPSVDVSPNSFATVDVWIPAQHPAGLMRQRNARFYSGFGRMKPGVTVAQARADMTAVARTLAEQFPPTDKGWSVAIMGLKENRVGGAGRPLVMLFGAVAMLLIITIINVAGLVLAQLHQRERELAVRASIGGTRVQVMGAVLREIVLLASAGALGGWALAAVSLRVLARAFANTPRIGELAPDWRPLLFAVAASLLATIGFGLVPAVRATRGDLTASLLRLGRGIAGSHQRFQRFLVTAQIALTMALVAGAGLLIRSYSNLTRVETGVDASRTVMFHVGAAWDENRALVGRLQEQLISDLRRLPGVEAAGITNFLPASGATLRYQAEVEGLARSEDQGKMPSGERTVSPGYLQALHVPLLTGEWCPELRLDFQAPGKAMVNRRFAEVYGRGENLVGRRLRLDGVPMQIVGIIGNVKEDSVAGPFYPYTYVCAMGGYWPDPEYVVRASGDPRGVLASIRQLAHNDAPNRAVFGVRTMEDAIGSDLDQPKSSARLLSLFAAAALLLAAVGIWGMVTETVNARRHEIGIRMAVGAQPAQIVESIVAGAGRLILVGALIGLVLIVVARPLAGSLLFGVGALDAMTLIIGVVVLTLVSTVAALVPARSAARVDPMESLGAK